MSIVDQCDAATFPAHFGIGKRGFGMPLQAFARRVRANCWICEFEAASQHMYQVATETRNPYQLYNLAKLSLT